MKFLYNNPLIFSALALTLAASSATAQNTFFTPGDLVLFFQKEGDDDTVYVSLGNAATVFRGSAAGPGAPNKSDFPNISQILGDAFGGGWASDPMIYAGLAGVWGTSNTNLVTLQNGDPHRTLYVSDSRNAVGTVGLANSDGWDLTTAGDTAMTGGASGIFSMNNPFELNYNAQQIQSPTSVSGIPGANPFLTPGVQGAAMNGLFGGGVQQVGTAGSFGTFGPAGSVEFALDLYRILSTTAVSGQVAGVRRVGSYEGTVTVNSSGAIYFVSQGAGGSSYDTWIGTFNPPLTNANDRLATADPDNDGFINLAEFVLNGIPNSSSQAIAPLLDASGANFVFSFSRRDDSKTEAPAIFQYGSDLVGWTNVPIGDISGPVGAATVTVVPGDAITDGISVSVPKTEAVGAKLFGRLKIVK